jgi:tetratricopeptide (TPR) repeat protein
VHRGVIAAMKHDLDRARRLSDDATALAERVGIPFYLAATNEFRGDFELQAGDAVAAERAFRKQYEILDRLGDEGHKSYAAGGLAHALSALGRVDEGETFAREAVAAAAEDDVSSQAFGRSALAAVHSLRGHHEEAIRLAREAAEMFARAESPNFQGDMRMTLARVLSAADQMADAADAARAAVTSYERKGNELALETARAFIASLPLG